jgi:Ca-activated chloride channel family protein
VRGKTVVRIHLASAEIARALEAKGLRQYSLRLTGTIRDSLGAEVESLSYPVSGDLSAGSPVSFSFLRALVPGAYRVEIGLGTAEKAYAQASFPIDVPEVGRDFRPEMAPNDYATLPSAEAVVLAAPDRDLSASRAPAGASKVKILPPDREAPVGIVRVAAEVEPPVQKVEFYLDDKLLFTRTRPPYTAEIDLGNLPRKQTVRVAGYDSGGNLIDEDAWSINEGDAKLAVHILPLAGSLSRRGVRVRIAVQSIRGGAAKSVEVFLDDKKIASFTRGPYEVVIPAPEYARAKYLRATAVSTEGFEANDIRFLHGPNVAAEEVHVDVVQLHVSALDPAGHFVRGLSESDFSVSEDGRRQKLLSFEVAENLPLNVGLVIDGSGSMRKSMEFVHTAGVSLFHDMIHEKDHGFVIQFREVPTLLCEPTSDVSKLASAVMSTDAIGSTALYDSIVLGLYQFRATSGRKALVVVSDGGDNHSWIDYPTLLRYVRNTAVPVYIIGVKIPFTEFGVKSKLKEISSDTGGEVYFTSNPDKIPEIVSGIERELRSQYVLSYRTDSTKPDGEFREVRVACDRPGLRLRTIRGYVP